MKVAVIGSGLGGLSAAALLARNGIAVDVFEQYTEPGGFATTYKRGPYRFEASLHLMDAVGPGEPNARLLEQLGIGARLKWRSPDPIRLERWVERGEDIVLGQGREAWVQTLARRFPGAGIEAFIARIGAIAERCHAVMASPGEPDPRDLAIVELSRRTALDHLREHVSDPFAREVLATMAIYQGLHPARISALNHAVVVYGYHGWSGSYPEGGSRALVEALVDVIRENGGAVHVGRGVTRIDVRRGKVRGLVLSDGTAVDADAIVSNVSPLITFGKLVPEDAVDARFRERLAGRELSCSFQKLHLALDVDTRSLADMPYEAFLHETGATNQGTPTPLVVTASHVADPTACPPGHGILAITRVASPVDDAFLPPEEKQRIGDEMLAGVEKHLLPGLSKHIVHRELAHPGTFIRYTGSPRGVTLGFAATPEQSGPGAMRTATPILGLYQAGGWVLPGAGQSAAMLSGRAAALAIARVLA